MGRTKIFKSNDELQNIIDDYFRYSDENNKPYTVINLCIYLGISRETLLRYETEYTEYSDTIKDAKLKIEGYSADALFTARNPSGIIFNLKNNFKWVDSHQVDANVNANINNIVIEPPKFDE